MPHSVVPVKSPTPVAFWVVGLAGMLGTLATLAGAFIYGRWSKQRELAEKRERIAQR